MYTWSHLFLPPESSSMRTGIFSSVLCFFPSPGKVPGTYLCSGNEMNEWMKFVFIVWGLSKVVPSNLFTSHHAHQIVFLNYVEINWRGLLMASDDWPEDLDYPTPYLAAFSKHLENWSEGQIPYHHHHHHLSLSQSFSSAVVYKDSYVPAIWKKQTNPAFLTTSCSSPFRA